MLHLEYIIIGSVGAAAVEIAMIAEYKHKLHLAQYKRLFASKAYWIVVFSLIFISGLFSWIIHAEEGAPWKTVLITGIAARSIVRQVGRNRGKLKLGPKSNGAIEGKKNDKVRYKDILSP